MPPTDEPTTTDAFATAADNFTRFLELANGQRLQAIALGFDETQAGMMGATIYVSMVQVMTAQTCKTIADGPEATP